MSGTADQITVTIVADEARRLADATYRDLVTASMPAARILFLRRYRARRGQGASPLTAMREVRSAAALCWADRLLTGFAPDPAELAVASVATEAMASRIGMSEHWWVP